MTDVLAELDVASQIKADKAMAITKRNMAWSAGAGVLPFPLFDLAAITAVELKLLKELADLYEIPYSHDLGKAAVVSLVGSLGGMTLGKMVAMTSLRIVPVLGPLMAAVSLPAVAAALTYAVGRVFTTHFDAGGTLLDFRPDSVRHYFREEFEKALAKAKAGEPAVDAAVDAAANTPPKGGKPAGATV